MKAYDASSIVNVGLFSHGGAGKTTLTEALLFKAGAITRLGRVEDGNTTTDFDPDETQAPDVGQPGGGAARVAGPQDQPDRRAGLRRLSSARSSRRVAWSTARSSCSTPLLALRSGTDAVWKRSTARMPRLIVVNKMERENADFERVLDQLRERYGKGIVPLTVPIGSEHGFCGRGRAGRAAGVHRRRRAERRACPDEVADLVEQQREALVEAACELDDELINKYLEGEELTSEEIRGAIRQGVVEWASWSRCFAAARPGRWARTAAGRHGRATCRPATRRRCGWRTDRWSRPRTTASWPRWSSRPSPTRSSGKLTFARVYSGGTQRRLARLERGEEPGRARRPDVHDARQAAGADAAASGRATSGSSRS